MTACYQELSSIVKYIRSDGSTALECNILRMSNQVLVAPVRNGATNSSAGRVCPVARKHREQIGSRCPDVVRGTGRAAFADVRLALVCWVQANGLAAS